MAFQQSLPSILAAMVADPVAIIVGLSIFVITIIAFPAILKISDTVTQIVLSTLFGFREAETLLPSDDESLEQDRSNEANPYFRPLRKMFSYLLNPSKSWKKIQEDWSFKEDCAEENIRKKLKSLFFILATIAAYLVYFFPPVASLGIIHVATAALLQVGLHQALAHYVITIIAGGLMYACRAPLVGAGLGIGALYRCCYESCRQKEPVSAHKGSTSQIKDSAPLIKKERNAESDNKHSENSLVVDKSTTHSSADNTHQTLGETSSYDLSP
jgi:hypothetical protein